MSSRTITATVNKKTRSKAMLGIIIFSLFAIFCIAMAIFDIIAANKLLGVLFGILAIVFITLLLLKINSVFGTYIRFKNDTLYIKSWVNNFLPYKGDGGFFADLKPSKTKLVEIPAEDISAVLIGTKDFVKRNATSAGKKLTKALYPYEHSKQLSRKRLISSIDLFYIETIDNECSFTCIHGYDAAAICKIAEQLYARNKNLFVKAGSRDYRHLARKLNSETEK